MGTYISDIKRAQINKEMQLDIILDTNPMLDDYHVGIRTIDDVKTFEEVASDGDFGSYGDFSHEQVKTALSTGRITVYSSKPIEQGNFVSTSYRMAKEYAGDDKVYSRTVPLSDVAWINGDEGQYAKVAEKDLKQELSKRAKWECSRSADHKNVKRITKEEFNEKQEQLKQLEMSYNKIAADLKEVRDAQNSLIDVKETVRRELGLSLFQFCKSEAYQRFSERSRFLENKHTQIKEVAVICQIQIATLKEECLNYAENKDTIEYLDLLDASGLSEQDFRRQRLLERFGDTFDPGFAGYIFPDGKMLCIDYYDRHDAVSDYFEPGSREYNDKNEAILTFISEGNIYWDPVRSELAIDTSIPMTEEQRTQVEEIIAYAQCVSGELKVDLLIGDGIESSKYTGKKLEKSAVMKNIEKNQNQKQKDVEIEHER